MTRRLTIPKLCISVSAVVGLVLATASCSGGEEADYTGEDIASFRPSEGLFTYGQGTAMIAGEAYQAGWPSTGDAAFEPTACLTYLAALEMLLATDESETSQDSLAFVQGMLADDNPSRADFVGVFAKSRTFSSTSAAQGYVSGLRSMVGPCTAGYTYSSEGFDWTVGSVTVSTTTLDGVGEVLVLDERDLVIGYAGDIAETYPHYTHYIFSKGNAAIVASYIVTTGTASDDDAAALLSEFVDHLG